MNFEKEFKSDEKKKIIFFVVVRGGGGGGGGGGRGDAFQYVLADFIFFCLHVLYDISSS